MTFDSHAQFEAEPYRPAMNPEFFERHEAIALNARYRFDPPLPPRVVAVIRDACHKHRIRIKDLMDGERTRPVCICRNEVVYRIRDHPAKPSFPTIGKWMGRDHTSCLWAASRHAADNGLPPVTSYDAEDVRAHNARRRALSHAKEKRERRDRKQARKEGRI